MATSLGQIILFRVIQGLAGGGLQPSSQGVLLDAFPPEKQGAAQTMFGIAALLAPVVGPTLGGYLTVQYNWRWIFYINLPVGALALLVCYFVVDDPDYLKQERAELRRRPLNFDYIGLGLLALVMSCWEIMLSKGQEWDWLGDPFWRVQTLLILFVLGLGCLIFREMRIANPVVNFRVLGERNLAASCIIIFCAYAVLYGASTSLPGLLQSLFGYDAYVSGLVQSPSGLFSILMLLVVGALLGRGTDARWLIAAGLLVMAAGCYWMALMNLYISPWQVVWPRVVMIMRPVDDLRSAQRGGLQIHPPAPARGGGRPVRPAPQRGRQRRHVDGPDHPGAARPVPHLARGRIPRPAQPGRELLPGPGPGLLLPANRRPGRVAADGLASAGGPPAAAGRVAGLLRRLLAAAAVLGVALVVSGAAHEALGGREGGAHWRGMRSKKDRCITCSTHFFTVLGKNLWALSNPVYSLRFSGEGRIGRRSARGCNHRTRKNSSRVGGVPTGTAFSLLPATRPVGISAWGRMPFRKRGSTFGDAGPITSLVLTIRLCVRLSDTGSSTSSESALVSPFPAPILSSRQQRSRPTRDWLSRRALQDHQACVEELPDTPAQPTRTVHLLHQAGQNDRQIAEQLNIPYSRAPAEDAG